MTYITIDGFENLTEQQVFDMALAHVRKTRQRSLREDNGRCAYTGIGCAASVFLKEEYKEKADAATDSGWGHLVYIEQLVPEVHTMLIKDLQGCHDAAANERTSERFMKAFESRMKAVAEAYGLQYTPEQ